MQVMKSHFSSGPMMVSSMLLQSLRWSENLLVGLNTCFWAVGPWNVQATHSLFIDGANVHTSSLILRGIVNWLWIKELLIAAFSAWRHGFPWWPPPWHVKCQGLRSLIPFRCLASSLGQAQRLCSIIYARLHQPSSFPWMTCQANSKTLRGQQVKSRASLIVRTWRHGSCQLWRQDLPTPIKSCSV